MNSSAVPVNVSEFGEFAGVNHQTTFTILSLLQITTGTLFNGIVISMLCVNHRLLEVPANVILLSLAISDFLACGIVLPYHVFVMLHVNESKVHQTILLFSMTVSMIGTVSLTGDRFLAIVYPLRYTLLVTIIRTRYVLLGNWVISLLYSILFFLALLYQVKGVRYILVLVQLCGVLTILVLYVVIFRAACRQIRRIESREGDAKKTGVVIFKKTLQSAKTSGCIVFFFAVSYLPVFVLAAINEARSVPLSSYNDHVVWLLCLAFLNCSINPLLYCMFSAKLRLVVLGYWRRFVARRHAYSAPAQSDARELSHPS